MVVPYIRDHEGLGILVKNNQPHNTFMVPWQYWLSTTKPKSAAWQKVATN